MSAILDLAIVPQTQPIVYRPDPVETVVASITSSATNATTATTALATTETVKRALQTVTSIYESYAVLYPNPRLVEERQERDELLRAISAATEGGGGTKSSSREREKGGNSWLKFLSPWHTSQRDSQAESGPGGGHPRNDDDDNNNGTHAHLLQYSYSDILFVDDGLCGTTASLDEVCIPPEAHAMARFHLASIRSHTPNIARTAWERPGTTLLTILGLGVLTESRGNGSTVTLAYTSDRLFLQKQRQRQLYQQQQQQPNGSNHDPFHVAHVRSAMIGPNLLAVSWGLTPDVIFYRRLAPGHQEKHWQAVALAGPSPPAVTECLEGDVFNENSTGLQITDIIPLVVEVTDQIPSATLVISRLGGFLELIPLPHAMWYGPELSVPTTKRNQPILPQIPDSTITTLRTTDYHTDIITLDAFRTSVEEDTEWDTKAYPKSPPAEHILAAAGSRGSDQTVSFWSVSTVFGATNEDKSIGFSLVARPVEAWDLGPTGSEISVFATPAILKYWRKPRSIRLKQSVSLNDSTLSERSHDSNTTTDADHRVMTISIPAPVVSMRFLNDSDLFRIAILDWNNGVTVMDCSLLERAVSQSLTTEEYNRAYGRGKTKEVKPLLTQINERTMVLDQLTSLSMPRPPPLICSLEWSSRAVLFAARSDPLIVLTTSEPSTLCIVSPLNSDAGPFICPLEHGQHIRLHRFLGTGSIAMVSFHERGHREIQVSFCDLAHLDRKEIVQSLAREGKYREAIDEARLLTGQDSLLVRETIEDCKRRIWEIENDLTSLESMLDDCYVAEQALDFTEYLANEDDESCFERFRAIHLAVLKRYSNMDKVRLDSTIDRARKVRDRILKLGTYMLLCDYFTLIPSWATFANDFLPMETLQLCKAFARAADIGALSIVAFRHPPGCLGYLTILDDIPPVVEAASYVHLLPLVGDNKNSFLSDKLSVLSPHSMPDYIFDRFGGNCILDDGEKQLASESSCIAEAFHCAEFPEDLGLDSWYLQRALNMKRFPCSLQSMQLFTKAALLVLDSVTSYAGSVECERLRALSSRYDVLAQFAAEQSSISYGDLLRLIDLEAMDASNIYDLVFMVLSGCDDSVQVFQQYKRLLIPLAGHGKLHSDSNIADEIAKAICKYCERAIVESRDAMTLRRAVTVSATVLSLSRADIERGKRVIKAKDDAMKLVLSLVESVIDKCYQIAPSMYDFRHVMNSMWTMYESLPIAAPDKSDFSDEYHSISTQIDRLYQNMVLLDVLYRWSGQQLLLPILSRIRRREESDDTEDTEVLIGFCRLFCDMLGFDGASGLTEMHLLDHFIHDIEELNQHVFRDSFRIKAVLSWYLMTPLLRQRNIQLFGHCLTAMRKDWVDEDVLAQGLNALIDEWVYAESGADAKKIVLQLLQLEAPIIESIPSVRGTISHFCRFLEASKFIEETFGSDKISSSTTNIHLQPPIRLLYLLINQDPTSVIHGQMEWRDDGWARRANKEIRQFLEKNVSTSAHAEPMTLPSFPGKTLLRLAQLLRLPEIDEAHLKLLMLRSAVVARLHGAAASLFRAYFRDMDCAEQLNQLLQVGAELMSEEYSDIETQIELCRLVLPHGNTVLSHDGTASFTKILHFYNEHKRVILPTSVPGCHPICSIQRLCYDTHVEYAVSLPELFNTLQEQLSACSIDDELLNALSRYLVFWCIAVSTRLRKTTIAFDKVCLSAVASLGCFFLMHINNKLLKDHTSSELSNVFKEQRDTALNQSHASDITSLSCPSKEIINRLMGYGYGLNGSIRAALMTENSGVKSALEWATKHCCDPDFDDPILRLNNPRHHHVDKSHIEVVNEALSGIQSFVADGLCTDTNARKLTNLSVLDTRCKDPIDLFPLQKPSMNNGSAHFDFSRNMSPQIEQTETLHKGGEQANVGSRSRFIVENPSYDNTTVAMLRTEESPRGAIAISEMKVSTKTDGDTKDAATSSTAALTRYSDTGNTLGNPIKIESLCEEPRDIAPNSRTIIPSLQGMEGNFIPSENTTTVPHPPPRANHSASPADFPSQPKSTLDGGIFSPRTRDSMRVSGEEAFRLFVKTPSPSKEERQRLIEEGRQLLRKSQTIHVPTPTRGNPPTPALSKAPTKICIRNQTGRAPTPPPPKNPKLSVRIPTPPPPKSNAISPRNPTPPPPRTAGLRIPSPPPPKASRSSVLIPSPPVPKQGKDTPPSNIVSWDQGRNDIRKQGTDNHQSVKFQLEKKENIIKEDASYDEISRQNSTGIAKPLGSEGSPRSNEIPVPLPHKDPTDTSLSLNIIRFQQDIGPYMSGGKLDTEAVQVNTEVCWVFNEDDTEINNSANSKHIDRGNARSIHPPVSSQGPSNGNYIPRGPPQEESKCSPLSVHGDMESAPSQCAAVTTATQTLSEMGWNFNEDILEGDSIAITEEATALSPPPKATDSVASLSGFTFPFQQNRTSALDHGKEDVKTLHSDSGWEFNDDDVDQNSSTIEDVACESIPLPPSMKEPIDTPLSFHENAATPTNQVAVISKAVQAQSEAGWNFNDDDVETSTVTIRAAIGRENAPHSHGIPSLRTQEEHTSSLANVSSPSKRGNNLAINDAQGVDFESESGWECHDDGEQGELSLANEKDSQENPTAGHGPVQSNGDPHFLGLNSTLLPEKSTIISPKSNARLQIQEGRRAPMNQSSDYYNDEAAQSEAGWGFDDDDVESERSFIAETTTRENATIIPQLLSKGTPQTQSIPLQSPRQDLTNRLDKGNVVSPFQGGMHTQVADHVNPAQTQSASGWAFNDDEIGVDNSMIAENLDVEKTIDSGDWDFDEDDLGL